MHANCLLWSPQTTSVGCTHYLDGDYYNLDRLLAYSRTRRKGKYVLRCKVCHKEGGKAHVRKGIHKHSHTLDAQYLCRNTN
jgi:hypothetical protein